MPLHALLLSHDPHVHRILRRALDDVSIDLQISNTADDATHTLSRRKYDAFLVDCDAVPNADQVLQRLRTGKSNRSCIAFALVNGSVSVQQAFQMGANFVLDKPLVFDRVTRT